jgi:hypothetical protein
MIADEKLAFIQIKVGRAKEHLNDLKTAIRVFFDSKPYVVSTKRDSMRRLIYYVSRVEPAPTLFATTTGDVIQNLRSALDHLAYQLFLVGTNGTTDGRHVYFPIDQDIVEYRRNLPRRTKGMRQDAIDTLNIIEPYKGGKGHDLWVLHELNNIDKHRLLVTVGSAYQSFNVGAHMRPLVEKQALAAGLPLPPKMDVYLRPADNLCPLTVGDQLFIDGVDAEENKEMDFRFDISLKEPGIAEGPLVDTLQRFCDLSSKTVLLFKPCLS